MVEGQKRRQILEEIRAGKLSARDGMIALQQLGQAPLSVVDTHMDEDTPEDAIAIVGMACRFPDAEDIDSFWQNLTAGRDSIRDQNGDGRLLELLQGLERGETEVDFVEAVLEGSMNHG